MKFVIEESDLATAPASVFEWIMHSLRLKSAGQVSVEMDPSIEPPAEEPAEVQEPPKGVLKKPRKTKTEVVEAPAVEPPSADDLVKSALAFMNANGEGKLREVLKTHGLTRVGECPADFRATLIAEMAIHA